MTAPAGASLALSIRVQVGTVEQVVPPDVGTAVRENGAVVGVLALAHAMAMGDRELGYWVRSMVEKAADVPAQAASTRRTGQASAAHPDDRGIHVSDLRRGAHHDEDRDDATGPDGSADVATVRGYADTESQ